MPHFCDPAGRKWRVDFHFLWPEEVALANYPKLELAK
jgi:hypothetical protein